MGTIAPMEHRKLLCLFLILSIGISKRVDAQSETFKVDHITVEEGLSQSTVYSITKDAYGFLWFGTRDGLNRYDSRSLKVYKNIEGDPTSLSGNNIHCFFTDVKNHLWIGTNEGISIYNPERDNFTQIKNDPKIKSSLSGNHVTSIIQALDGTVWVGTNNGLNKVLNTESYTFQHFQNVATDGKSLLDNEVRNLFFDRENVLWIASTSGVSKLIPNNGQPYFENYPLISTDRQGKSWINCLEEDDYGNILIGTEQNGLKVLNKKSGKIKGINLDRYTNRNFESIRVISRDNDKFLIGTIDGLYVLNEKLETTSQLRNILEDNTSLNDNSVRSIFIDPSGIYWIGTFYGGVNFYSPLSKQFSSVRFTDQNSQRVSKLIGAITTDENSNLWVSTDGNGLYCVNKEGETIHQFKHSDSDPNSLSHNKIKCLLIEKDGIWIGTLKGLNYYHFLSKKFTHYYHDLNDPNSIADDRIYNIKKDTNGTIWIATYRGGLCKFNPDSKTFSRLTHNETDTTSLSSEGITYLYVGENNTLWVGTVAGLNKMDSNGKTFIRYGNSHGNLEGEGDYILCITEDYLNNLWIGTRDAGLKRILKGSNKITAFTAEDGLPGNTVNGILEDSQGALWLSTNNGLSRLDPVTMQFKNYNKNDGLTCKEFNFNSFHKDSQENMYFGGYNGIVKFNPAEILENNTPPPLQFTKLKLFKKESTDQKENSIPFKSLMNSHSLSFNYLQNVFSIEFVALSYINSNKNRYAYQLVGFEDQWNYVSDPVATYMNLSPGNYTLLVKASNNDNVWTTEPLRMEITVLPPPWKTWWAYCIYASIILGLIYSLIRFNKMRWKLTHDLRIEHIEKEQQEKLHRSKLAFFTNIAHEIRTPLTLIVSPIEIALQNYSGDSFLQKQLRLVKSNTNRLTRLINQLLDFQKQESGTLKLKRVSGNIVELVKEITYSFSEYAKSRNITVKLNTTHDELAVNYDPNELEKVFCNLLHNAFKFTPGGGNILISISVMEGINTSPSVKIIVEDNGIGIHTSELPKIFNRFFQVENHGINESGFGIGLALTKGIIDLHEGSISVESEEADLGHTGFTRFTILLPLASKPEIVLSEFTSDAIIVSGGDIAEEHNDKVEKRFDTPLLLLVEDNPEIRECLRTILHNEYAIIEASNGEEALELTMKHLPDLIVSDIAMPLMDGIEFTLKVKKDERTDHIPIILLTARGAMEHHVEGIESGADDYITKPFQSQILQLKIRNLLSTREKLREKYHKIITLEPQSIEIEDPENKFLGKLMNILEKNLNDPEFNVARLTKEIGMSRPVLFRKVKILTGLSVIDLIRTTRLKKAEMLLKQRKMSISEVAFSVGFNDPKHFSKSFRSQFGKTPTEYMETAKS